MFLVVFRNRKRADIDAEPYDKAAGAQARGWREFYAEYTLFACDQPKVHQFRAESRSK